MSAYSISTSIIHQKKKKKKSISLVLTGCNSSHYCRLHWILFPPLVSPSTRSNGSHVSSELTALSSSASKIHSKDSVNPAVSVVPIGSVLKRAFGPLDQHSKRVF